MILKRTAMHNVAAHHEHFAFIFSVLLQCISAVCHRGLEVILVLPKKNPYNCVFLSQKELYEDIVFQTG